MIVSLLYVLLFAISGICVSEVVFQKHRFANRIWLGLVLGLLLLTWLPALFALLFGFTLTAQILAFVTVCIVGCICSLITVFRKRKGIVNSYRIAIKYPAFFLIVPIIFLGSYLFYTHVLYKHSDGSLWVGQVTFGDLAMHLGFVSSIAEQKVFPPQYSIFPGHALNYPFLCETSASTLYQLGASLRQAYLISAVYALVLVVVGVYKFFEQWLKRADRATLATFLFFFGGGFGFFYFFDLLKTDGILTNLLSSGNQTTASLWLNGFYITPTNIPDLGLRWVNPIVDMLIPQRATLFGWAFLFPCLYLLHGYAFEKKTDNVLPLAVIAGLLPMIHTHSFLALGIISAVYCVCDLIRVRFARKRIVFWLLYAGITCLLAFPQLFAFTFRQTSEGRLVQFHWNWANSTDSYLWFYIKNLGLIFLLLPIAFFLLSKKDKRIYAGVLPLWLISEFVIFQINEYDNNKLLFVWFAYTCALVAKLLITCRDRVDRFIRKNSSEFDRSYTYGVLVAALLLIFTVYFFIKTVFDNEYGLLMRQSTALTLFFLAGMVLSMCIAGLSQSHVKIRSRMIWIAETGISAWLTLSVFIVWYLQYDRDTLSFTLFYAISSMLICVVGILLLASVRLPDWYRGKKVRFIGAVAVKRLCVFLLVFSMTVSSLMTILRECKSHYQVYSSEEVSLMDAIRENTNPEETILASSYLWNLVTPMTGRNIVTGTGTFLFFHGVTGFAEREIEVRQMYENPAENKELFQRYGIRYVLISNAERGYLIDYEYFEQHGTVVAANRAGTLYLLSE